MSTMTTATATTKATVTTPVFGAPEGWDAFLLARRRGEFAGPVLHVTRDDARMARLAEALAFVVPEAEILRFPAWDCLPYDRVSPNPALVSERIATLARLLDKPSGPRIVLTTVNALVQRVPPRAAFAGASMELRVNGTVQPEKLARFLEAHGYGRAGTVMEPGEYAIRGGIIDVFPAGEADPVRLDLFGDTIESIRVFDASSQRSAGKRNSLTLRPVSEVPLGKEALKALTPMKQDAGLVFTKGGKPIKDFRRTWEKALLAAGIEGKHLFHGNRRSQVMNLMASDVDEQVAMSITGHNDTNTFRGYRVLLEEAKRAAIAQRDKARRK